MCQPLFLSNYFPWPISHSLVALGGCISLSPPLSAFLHTTEADKRVAQAEAAARQAADEMRAQIQVGHALGVAPGLQAQLPHLSSLNTCSSSPS